MRGIQRGMAAATLLVLVAATGVGARGRAPKEDKREKTLYIWAGDQARQRPDFLAVIDFNERSATYGKVLRTMPLPPPSRATRSCSTRASSSTSTPPSRTRRVRTASR